MFTSLTLIMLAILEDTAKEPGSPLFVYVGTYTSGASEGIYLLRLDTEEGRIESLGLAAKTENPSFLAVHPSKPLLYAAGEAGEGGAVSAYSIRPGDCRLELLNRSSSVGAGPCHVAVDRAGRHVLVANYGGGSVAVLPIAESGELGEACAFVQHEGSSVHPQRQQSPHAHSITLDAAGRFAVAADLGLDKLLVYRYDDALGKLEANEPPFAQVAPGAGPRHFAFHPNGHFAYVVNELANTVTAFAYDAAAGRLDTIHSVSTLPDGFDGTNTGAEIRAHPSGRFMYCSNRGHDSIAAFAVDEQSGRLTSLGQTLTQGQTPRNFNIDPSGRFLLAANQTTNTVVLFRIDADTGGLTPEGTPIEVPAPVCVVFFREAGVCLHEALAPRSAPSGKRVTLVPRCADKG